MSFARTLYHGPTKGCLMGFSLHLFERWRPGNIRPYLVHVKCTLHIGFHLGLHIQGFKITDGNSAGKGNEHEGFLHGRSLSQY